ncbi:bifunctional 4-hydroxy-2-oxoglutarate aldolase/2-dehydro-3-deoxy-phosphogluconate aldolase [Agromyces bauzanensis]|uniref:Aldolase n=1 Tax=Agromyces bauzanensis TaxID=1308924 RepID=A0A917PLE5_9MICO|nr:bifunctional 4-hydroxy-2-oxoglutarate aldolase/2-dehydro-3-deoxy-phosphogluconate aldolase [Agromyces bauzanensis]GGJ83210.1 aldolase [Agromyces bauzanensis]
MSSDWFELQLAASPVLVILRGLGPARSVELAERAWAAGVPLVEIPLQRPDDALALRAVRAAGGTRPVGAGTVLDVGDLDAAAGAGADFAVSPGVDTAVLAEAAARGIPLLPGVATATDIQTCLTHGYRWLKAFPAAQLGTGWFAAMRGPFPDVSFVATGGVTPAEAADYLAAGARAVALGSAFAGEDAVAGVAALLAGPAQGAR